MGNDQAMIASAVSPGSESARRVSALPQLRIKLPMRLISGDGN
jgi:hypothetical protein